MRLNGLTFAKCYISHTCFKCCNLDSHGIAAALIAASPTILLYYHLHDKRASPGCTVKFKSFLTNTLRSDQSIDEAMFLQVLVQANGVTD